MLKTVRESITTLLGAALVFATLLPVSPSAFGADPSGRWKGRWSSGTTGHSGPMRARVTPNEDGSYRAVFSGRFALVIPFVYRADLQPVQTWAGTSYVVDKKLGPILGSYRMNAFIPGDTFNANFSAAGDSGQISMQRVGY
jgi:hypothetical protein